MRGHPDRSALRFRGLRPRLGGLADHRPHYRRRSLQALSADLERFLRRNVEGRFWYTGMHPDLPPEDFEQDSIYAVVEYWLDKHDRTGTRKASNARWPMPIIALLYWCPKQLSWVKQSHAMRAQRATAFQPVFRLLLRQSENPVPGPLIPQNRQSLVRTTQAAGDAIEFLLQVVDSPYRAR